MLWGNQCEDAKIGELEQAKLWPAGQFFFINLFLVIATHEREK